MVPLASKAGFPTHPSRLRAAFVPSGTVKMLLGMGDQFACWMGVATDAGAGDGAGVGAGSADGVPNVTGISSAINPKTRVPGAILALVPVTKNQRQARGQPRL
jgi:hypothetical protein